MAYLHKSVQEFQASAIYSCWKISDKNCHKIIPNYALMLDGISHTRKINVNMSKYWQDYTNFSLSCNLPIRLSGSVYTTLHRLWYRYSLGVDVISNSLKTYIRGKRIIYCDQIFEIFTSKFAIAVRDCAFSKKVNSDLHTDDIVVTIFCFSP